jgi:hypothetical protein
MVPPAARVSPSIHPTANIARYAGQVVYIYAFDVAYEMRRRPIETLLGQPVREFVVESDRRTPRHHMFYRPQMVTLPAVERIGPAGPVMIERSIKLLPVGAISITVRVPFEVGKISDLVRYHDLHFQSGALYDEVRQLAEDVRRELREHYVRPNERLVDEEAYTVFCINAPLVSAGGEHIGSEDWLQQHRREIASVLTQENETDHLSDQEALESTGRYLSYYDHDLVVVDWDAALILDQPRNFDETLYIMELANLQLAELEAYDRMLDESAERAYRDAASPRTRGKPAVTRQLMEIRIDLSRLSDELLNITKFFGDWHLARVYGALSSRFHLADWHRTINEKLQTLDDLYQIFKHDQNNRLMLMVVVLFVIDLVILVMGLKN